MRDSKPIIEFIEHQILTNHNSVELQGLIDQLPEDELDAQVEFCEAFDLGHWFVDAMIMNNIDISEVLIDVAETRRAEEKEAEQDRADMERDYQRSQGWPV